MLIYQLLTCDYLIVVEWSTVHQNTAKEKIAHKLGVDASSSILSIDTQQNKDKHYYIPIAMAVHISAAFLGLPLIVIGGASK